MEKIRSRRRTFKIIFLAAAILFFGRFGKQTAWAGSATVSWVAPIANEDDSALTDLDGFVVYYGTTSQEGTCPVSITSAAPYDSYIDVADADATSQIINNLTDGVTYYFTVVAYDTSDNISACAATDAGGHTEVSKAIPAVEPAADETGPVISDLSIQNREKKSARIAFTTDEAAKVRIEYGKNTFYGSITDFASSFSTSQSVALAGLSSGTTYHYRIIAQDENSNQTVGSDQAFKTKSKSKKKKKKSSSKRKITNSPKKVVYGQIMVQSGKKFSKASPVLLYFSRLNGSYYPPRRIMTTKTGTFSLAFRATKARGTYSWYAVDVKTGKKSKTLKYVVK